jgi:peptide/nickel transport system substrate-binding protein
MSENKRVTRRQVIIRGGYAGAGVMGLNAFLAACGGGGGDGKTDGTPATGDPAGDVARGGAIVWALSADPTFMIPYGATLTETRQATEFVYQSLLQWDKDLKIIPALAESYDTPDDKTYVFKLRQGVTFHDGTPFTAKDVVYSAELWLDPPPPGTPDTVSQVPGIDKVEAVDDATVKITMKTPDARLPGFLAWGRYSSIVPDGLYDKIDPRTEANGSGPFSLVEFRQNDRITYKKNPKYWDPELPGVDDLTLRVLPDEQGRLAALKSGEIHGCTVSSDIAKTLEADPNIEVLKGNITAHREIQFTIKKGEKKPWHDVKVRQAINHAINRQDVIDRVFGGNADWSSIIPPGYGDFPVSQEELKSNFQAYDVDKARTLMTEAGVADGFKVELQVFTATADTQQIAQIIQQQLKEIKVELTLRPLEVAVFAKNNGAGDFDMQLTTRGMRGDVAGYTSDFDPEAAIFPVWFPGADQNPQIGELIKQGFTTLDQAARVPIYKQIQELVLPDALHIPICNPYKFQAMSKNVKGMYVGYTDFNPGLVEARMAKA